jgi:type II secretory pathway pseudopilin PulG
MELLEPKTKPENKAGTELGDKPGNKASTSRFTMRRKRAGEQGYILLAVLFLVVIMLIALSLAAPKMAADIERDREMETIHRGKQYVRAIKLYYKKFGAYPPNLDALEKTNQIRFLRKRYKDPITGKDEWHLIHFGENKTPSYGFFGQPIGGTGGSAIAGTGPGGVGSSLTASTFGSSSSSGSSFGSGSFGSSSFGSNSTTGSTTSSSGTDSSSGSTTGTTSTTSGSSTGTDSSSTSGSSTSSVFGSSNGQTFGGGGIIGVESTSPKLAILVWKKKTHFNEWEFWYDPNADRITISSSSLGTSTSTSTSSPSLFNQAPGTSSTTTTGTTTTGTTTTGTTSPQ